MKNQTAHHLATIAATLARLNHTLLPHQAAHTIVEAHRLAKALRQRWANQCSYPWANTPDYERRTDKLEDKLLKHLATAGIACTLQRDPRGWPLILTIGGEEYQVGGEV